MRLKPAVEALKPGFVTEPIVENVGLIGPSRKTTQ